MSPRDRLSFLDRSDEAELPLLKQAELLGVSRSSIYYEPTPLSKRERSLMRDIDELYTAYPFYGSRRIAKELGRKRNEQVNRKCIQRLMRLMGIEAIYPKPNLSLNTGKHPVYPYLLKGVMILRPNQVWSIDITYIRLKHGFVYLVAIIDWYSRLVLAWRLSTTMEVGFCLEVAQEAIDIYGLPEIFNSDQGVQFTAGEFVSIWETRHVKISMDGRGRALDNIFVERLWRSVKYENIYLNDYESVQDVREGLCVYFLFYNTKRLHQSLNYQTPMEVHFKQND